MAKNNSEIEIKTFKLRSFFFFFRNKQTSEDKSSVNPFALNSLLFLLKGKKKFPRNIFSHLAFYNIFVCFFFPWGKKKRSNFFLIEALVRGLSEVFRLLIFDIKRDFLMWRDFVQYKIKVRVIFWDIIQYFGILH